MIPVSAICLCSLYKNGGDAVRAHHVESKTDIMTTCAQANQKCCETPGLHELTKQENSPRQF